MSAPAGPDPAALRAVLAAIDPALRLTGSRDLAGGVSARVTAIEAARPGGGQQTLVLRQYGPANLAADPESAPHEFALLRLLHDAGLPVPRPYLAGPPAGLLPGPWLVTEFIDGQPITTPAGGGLGVVSQLAAALARLHQACFGLAERPHLTDIRARAANRTRTWPATLDESLNEAAVRAALADQPPPPPLNAPRLLHGDFWPGNTLWRDGGLAGVIDWEDAVLGDPLADLGIARHELAMMFGLDAAADFTGQYLALMPGLVTSSLPVWDLHAALRPAGKMAGWGMPPHQLAAMTAGHRAFVTSVLTGSSPTSP
jgi:aminoglycoside phosphotransferase (APT) family kinase protein